MQNINPRGSLKLVKLIKTMKLLKKMGENQEIFECVVSTEIWVSSVKLSCSKVKFSVYV